MMARIQPIDNNSDAKPTYDVGVISEVNASQINLIKHITVDDQLDSDIIFDDPYVEVNSGQVEHDQDAPDQKFVGFKSLINNVQIEVVKEEITKEVQEMLGVFKSMKSEVNENLKKHEIFQNEIDRLLETTLVREIRDCVMISVEQNKSETLRDEIERISNDSKVVQANLLKRIRILENDFQMCQAQSINFELQMQHQKEKNACDNSWTSKMEKLNDENVPFTFQVESLITERESVKIENQKLFNSIKTTLAQHQREVNELIENVNQKTYAYGDAMNDDSNVVCVSCGKDVFMLSHDKCVARYALFVNSRVKRALFISPLATKTRVLGATPVVAKSKFSVATPTTTTTLGWHLEEIHVTWAHLEKKRTRLRLYTKSFEETVHTEGGDGVVITKRRLQEFHIDGVTDFATASERSRLKGEDLLTDSRDSNRYTISISKMAASSPVCLMYNASSTKSYLWHRVSTTEPKNIKKVMLDQSWMESMQEELNQFQRLNVWELVKDSLEGILLGLNGFGKTRLM
ncbi:hypothetical protein Tco_0493823 [Tanacetum coccineum]